MTLLLKELQSSDFRLTKKVRATMNYLEAFVKKNKRFPTVYEVADRFDLAISAAWERIQKAKRLVKTCAFCGHKI